jgi:hypothetical protein
MKDPAAGEFLAQLKPFLKRLPNDDRFGYKVARSE